MIKDILLFVLNTKRPLSKIWLLRYKQDSLGCFRKNVHFQSFQKHTQEKLFCCWWCCGHGCCGYCRLLFCRLDAIVVVGLVVVVVINVGPRNLSLEFGQNKVRYS